MMKRNIFVGIICGILSLSFLSCGVSNNSFKRTQELEENVNNPTTIEELQEAIEKYKDQVSQIQQANSQIGIWYKILGTRYVDQKMYGEALKCFEEALKYYPDNQNLYYYVGVCAGYMSHASMDFDARGFSEIKYNYLKLSEEAFSRAIQIDDRYVRALYGLGVLYVYELDECDKAIPYLEKILKIDTKNIDAMTVLALAYFDNKEFDKSAQMYDTILNTTKSEQKKALAAEGKKRALDALY